MSTAKPSKKPTLKPTAQPSRKLTGYLCYLYNHFCLFVLLGIATYTSTSSIRCKPVVLNVLANINFQTNRP